LDRALGNLIRNAQRYAGAAGPIEIVASAVDRQILVRVLDSGPGVPPEALPDLFTPFFRPDTARIRMRSSYRMTR
jgi:signal transduction histidine kinase